MLLQYSFKIRKICHTQKIFSQDLPRQRKDKTKSERMTILNKILYHGYVTKILNMVLLTEHQERIWIFMFY